MNHQYTESEKARVRDMIVVFQEAQKTLRQAVCKDGAGLCWAIHLTMTKANAGTHSTARDDAADLVKRSLAGSTYLESWQALHHGIPYPRHKDGSRGRRLGDRRRWLNQLIRDCQAALEG